MDIQNVKNTLNSSKLASIFPVPDTVCWVPRGFNAVYIKFDDSVKNLDRVRVGTAYRIRGGSQVKSYGLLIEKTGQGWNFEWKDGFKPEDYLKVQKFLIS